MTEDDIESTRLSSRKVDAEVDHTRLSSRKVDAVDDHTRLSSRKVDAVDDHTRLSSRKVDAEVDHTRLSSRAGEAPVDATSISVTSSRATGTKQGNVLSPPPASLRSIPTAVHGSFGGEVTSYDAREQVRVRSVSIARGAAPDLPGASVAPPEVRAARLAKRRRARLYGWIIGAVAVVAVAAGVAALAWV